MIIAAILIMIIAVSGIIANILDTMIDNSLREKLFKPTKKK